MSLLLTCERCGEKHCYCPDLPEEPARADLPASPSRAYAEGFREGWIAAWEKQESRK